LGNFGEIICLTNKTAPTYKYLYTNYGGIFMTETKRASQRKFHIIYKTTCSVTGKWYIGMHSTDKIDDGYKGSGTHLWHSIKKYGKENHTTEILEYLSDRKSLAAREEVLIAEAKKDPKCMNIARGGEGYYDRPPTAEETKAKLSAASKNYVRTPEWYEKIVESRKKNGTNLHTAETKKRLSEVQTGKVLSEEHKTKIGKSLKGHEVSDETRKNLSKALKGNPKLSMPKKPVTDEARENIRKSRIGKKHSEEAKANMRKHRKTTAKMCKPCTLDGVEIFPSIGALKAKYGAGKNGTRSTNLKYVEVSV